MTIAEDITPAQLRCASGLCLSVTPIPDSTDLVIVGKIAAGLATQITMSDGRLLSDTIGPDETAVRIGEEYFSELAAIAKQRNDIGILLAQIDFLTEATGEGLDCQDAGLVEQIRADYRAALSQGKETT